MNDKINELEGKILAVESKIDRLLYLFEGLVVNLPTEIIEKLKRRLQTVQGDLE